MANSDLIIAALRASGEPMTDRQLQAAIGSLSVQAVNRACRRLAARGLIDRTVDDGRPIENALRADWDSVAPAGAASGEQQLAEALMIEQLAVRVGQALAPAKLVSPGGATVNIDAVAADQSVLAECWAHQGKAKVAQKWKLVNDAVKLNWVATWLKEAPTRLILCVSDDAAVAHLRGSSWQRQAIENLGVTIEVVALPIEQVSAVVAAQRRQGQPDSYARALSTPSGRTRAATIPTTTSQSVHRRSGVRVPGADRTVPAPVRCTSQDADPLD